MTEEELKAVHALHPDKLTFRYPRMDWPNGVASERGGQGFSRDSEGRISDAAFHAEILGDDD